MNGFHNRLAHGLYTVCNTKFDTLQVYKFIPWKLVILFWKDSWRCIVMHIWSKIVEPYQTIPLYLMQDRVNDHDPITGLHWLELKQSTSHQYHNVTHYKCSGSNHFASDCLYQCNSHPSSIQVWCFQRSKVGHISTECQGGKHQHQSPLRARLEWGCYP